MSVPSTNYTLSFKRGGTALAYTLTPEDVLTFARVLAHEGPPERTIAWALLQRFASFYKKSFTTFTKFLQAYAQPINPKWFPNGELHLKQIEYFRQSNAGQDKIDDENARAQRRVRQASQRWEEIPQKFRDIVAGIMSGEIRTPNAQVTDYRASMAAPGDNETVARQKAQDFARRKGFAASVDVGVGFARGTTWFFTQPRYQVTEAKVGASGPLGEAA